jgi:hypothetical protein
MFPQATIRRGKRCPTAIAFLQPVSGRHYLSQISGLEKYYRKKKVFF